jgi:protein SCO1/2
MAKRSSALYVVPLLLAAAAAGYMVSRQLSYQPPQLTVGTAMPEARPVPAFQLHDHNGAAFGNAELAGRPSLLFFGFTHCPDVCPTTLALMAQLVRDPALSALRPVFVTVDPDRDDQQALAQYVAAFGGGITGLRGTEAELAPLLNGLLVAHAILPLPGGGYTVDHSASLYFLDTSGAWSAVFTPPFSLPALKQDLTTLLATGH